MLPRLIVAAFLFIAASLALADGPVLQNKLIRVEFTEADGAITNTALSRANGDDRLVMQNDEFELLLFDGSRFTVSDYTAIGQLRVEDGGSQTLGITYRAKPARANAPRTVIVTYTLGDGPYVRKLLEVPMKRGEKIDRIQILRFSTDRKAQRGGQGQPVFVGPWFFGVDYPGFYSRHSDGFVEPDFFYRHPYTIDFEGRDREFARRKGLVTAFHFPGFAVETIENRWRVRSKTAVCGISRNPGETAELALLDYIEEIRKPIRSHLHFNNWYSRKAKTISVETFVNNTFKPIRDRLAPYSVRLDAMTPDHGWEDSKTGPRIYAPRKEPPYDPLVVVEQALRKAGTRLGIWIALDGTNQNMAHGLELGYRSAFRKDYDRSRHRWQSGKDFFDMLQPKYLADLKESLRYLLVDCKVDYVKHDFNHNFTSHYITDRHAREKCLDTTLELLAYERRLNPNVFQNYTNGTWFSPWWLQHVDSLWMMSGDSGGGGAWPAFSLRDGATTYRDKYFFQNHNNLERTVRCLIPVANFMTHGILFTESKPFTDFKDTVGDWADYVMMYYARGTNVKELYISPALLDEDHWKVLGTTTSWAQNNQSRLKNTVYIGGDPEKGRPYAYVSWVKDRAILTVRNPDRGEQILRIPFDRSVYYRGANNRPYHARTIYPYVEQMPWKLISGAAFEIGIPGDSTLVYEIEPGPPQTTTRLQPSELPEPNITQNEHGFTIQLTLPDEQMPRCDLLIQSWALVKPRLKLNGRPVEPRQFRIGRRWTLAAYDLRKYHAKTVEATALMKPLKDHQPPKSHQASIEAWLTADRPVKAPPAEQKPKMPYPLAHSYRRQNQNLLKKSPFQIQQ
jgi:hypothetical protein